jgi:acyl-CoA synthetase (AMP-forming)/AMP-acid ligase II
LFALLTEAARRDSAGVALLAPGRAPLSYGRLLAEVEAVAATLRGFGIGPGDRVAVVLPSGPEMAVAFLGITVGAACVPLNPAYLPGELEQHLRRVNVTAVMVEGGVASPAREVAQRLGLLVVELLPTASAEAGVFTLSADGAPSSDRPRREGVASADDVCLVLHTSGTTSQAKIVVLTQRNLHASARVLAEVLGLGPADRCLNVMPLFHIHGLSTVYGSIAGGASVVLPGAFDPALFLDWVEAFDPTWTTAAPTIHHSILEASRRRAEVLEKHPFRFLRSASSAMPPQLIAELERTFNVPFVEAYGMTEACPPVSNNPLPPAKRKLGSAGPAVPGCEIGIMSDDLTLLPRGKTGEVVVKGPNVIERYENNPAADRVAFVDGWFRTGDQGYLDDDGFLFITGRLKEIINRGGEKIAPREIDEVLCEHPAVSEAAAFAVPHVRLGEDVAAAVVLRPGMTATPQEIQAFAAGRLADFKVPRQVVIVPKIPSEATGKQKRIALAAALGLVDAPGVAAERTPFVAPRTPTEEIIAGIFAQILGPTAGASGQPIGIHDNFFRLGGESLMAVRVLGKIRQVLKVGLKVQDFFLGPTVADLARSVEAQQARTAPGRGSEPIPRLGTGVEAPLSFVQEGLWFLDQLEPANAAYNVYRAARLDGPLDLDLLERAIQEVVRRHNILRTTFPPATGRGRRVIAPELKLAVPRIDLRSLSPAERQAEAERLAVEDARTPFDLAKGPLLRTTLVLLGPDEHMLLLAAHHIVIDLWSTGVLFRELGALYAAFAEGRPSALPELQIQHSDFAAWQVLGRPQLEQQVAYWKQQLADLPPRLPLPTDRPRPAAGNPRGTRRFFELPPGLSKALVALSQKEGVTLYMTLLAAFDVLLAKVSGLQDVVVGSPIANRNRSELEEMIGIFSNTLVFRTRMADTPTFKKLLTRVREVALGAYAHQDLPFEQLVTAIQPASERARMPLFQVNFRVQSDPVQATLVPGVSLTFLKVSNQLAKFDLAIEFSEAASGITGFVEYRTDLFDAETIERLLSDLESILRTVTQSPDVVLSAIELSLRPTAKDEPMSPPTETPAVEPPLAKPRGIKEVRRKAVNLETPDRKPD